MNDIIANANYEGFAQANMETMELLEKALTAGSGADAGSFTGGRALIPESLDQTLVNILHTQDEAVLFQLLKKIPIKSPVHQWDERTEVGADDGAWVAEGGESAEADQTIARKYVTAKYLQTLRKVTLQATVSNMIEDAIALEKNAGTLWLIRNQERALFEGDSAMVPLQPDGLRKLIPSGNVIDMRGADGTSSTMEDKFTESCRVIRENYGKASNMLSSTMVMQDIQALLRDRIRFQAGETQGSAIFSKYPTPFGSPNIKEDIFLRDFIVPAASALSGRPGTATPMTLGSATTPVDATALFGANDAGDYVFKIEPINQYGAGASVEVAATGLVAGDNHTIPITQYPVPAATAYKIYRGKKGSTTSGTVYYAFTVSQAQVVADGDDVLDRNFDLPGCSSMYVLTMDQLYNAIEWAQFLPMMKFDLYPTNAAVTPFLMLLFGALALKKPVQHVRIKNISPSTLGWF